VCLDSRVKSIIPIPEDSGVFATGEDTVDCSKLVLTEPYNGEYYHIILKSKASTADLYRIIGKMELETQNDNFLSFSYHHAEREGRTIRFTVTMNVRALKLVSV